MTKKRRVRVEEVCEQATTTYGTLVSVDLRGVCVGGAALTWSEWDTVLSTVASGKAAIAKHGGTT